MLADVAGHGEDAAELGQVFRGLMRKHINQADQTGFAQTLNSRLTQVSDAGRFATAVLTTWYRPDRILVLTTAGHPDPLYWTAATQSWSVLTQQATSSDVVTDLPLGIIDGTQYSRTALPMSQGDLVVLYCDAFIEARNAGGEMIGIDGLLDSIQDVDTSKPIAAARGIFDAVARWRQGDMADDGQTVLVLQCAADAGHRAGFLGRLAGSLRVLGLGRVQRRKK